MPAAKAPTVRVRDVRAFDRKVPTRMPFRFGTVTLRELRVVYLRVRLEVAGRTCEGIGASASSPAWCDKDPERSFADKERNLLRAVGIALAAYRDAAADTAWSLHRSLEPDIQSECAAHGIAALPASFGAALLDSAIVDGLCRHHEVNLHTALRGDLFGLGALPLPDRPSTRLAIRHTVGLGDPLADGDLEARLDDGLPETLEEIVREYGVRWFKVKIAGDVEHNLARLRRIAEVLQRVAPEHRLVLDGNESFADMAAFAGFVDALLGDSALSALRSRLLWFEQPVARDAALEPGVAADLRRVTGFRPVVLDESDGSDEVAARALELGYGGVSAKNCKGVFRTLHNHRLLAEQKPPGILAAEDLTNPCGFPLHQDTAVVAALGLPHAERNGHHYTRGLAHLTEREQEAALREFPSLYERAGGGLARLCIKGGAIDVRELVASGYGTQSPPDEAALTPLELPA